MHGKVEFQSPILKARSCEYHCKAKGVCIQCSFVFFLSKLNVVSGSNRVYFHAHEKRNGNSWLRNESFEYE